MPLDLLGRWSERPRSPLPKPGQRTVGRLGARAGGGGHIEGSTLGDSLNGGAGDDAVYGRRGGPGRDRVYAERIGRVRGCAIGR